MDVSSGYFLARQGLARMIKAGNGSSKQIDKGLCYACRKPGAGMLVEFVEPTVIDAYALHARCYELARRQGSFDCNN